MPTKSGLAELPVVLEPHDVMTSVAITLRAVRAPIVRKPPRVGCFTFSLLRGSSWSPVADDRNWSAEARSSGPSIDQPPPVTHNRISNTYWQEGNDADRRSAWPTASRRRPGRHHYPRLHADAGGSARWAAPGGSGRRRPEDRGPGGRRVQPDPWLRGHHRRGRNDHLPRAQPPQAQRGHRPEEA